MQLEYCDGSQGAEVSPFNVPSAVVSSRLYSSSSRAASSAVFRHSGTHEAYFHIPKKICRAQGIISIAVMPAGSHSFFHAPEQVKYHAHFLAASTSPAEACRKQLHVVVIIHAVLSLCFFSAVLALMDRQLWLAVIFMSGLTQFTANIGGMLTLQMWIYT